MKALFALAGYLSLAVCFVTAGSLGMNAQARAGDETWIRFEGTQGPGLGKHIVLVSGDDEYRSEQTLPQLAKILARHHGFTCSVLFAIDTDGTINPTKQDNIPGLAELDNADLMVMFLRFRNLPNDQMKHVVDYVESGRPIVALRTSTHAFNFTGATDYPGYHWQDAASDGGFGRRVLGETWVSHHGNHGSQSTRGILAADQKEHAILRGLTDGAIWGPTDVYGVRLPLPEDSLPLVMGQVVEGMHENDPPAAGPKNEPMMPVAWTKTYHTPTGKDARTFTTTMGAAQDFSNAGLRRLLVNACYWGLQMEDQIDPNACVDIVGKYEPLPFGFGTHAKGIKPADLIAD